MELDNTEMRLLALESAKAAPSGVAIGASIFAAIVLAAIIWYCRKHKGWDLPQVCMGFVFAVTLLATPLGGLLTGISDGIQGVFGGLATAINSLG